MILIQNNLRNIIASEATCYTILITIKLLAGQINTDRKMIECTYVCIFQGYGIP